MTSNGQPGDAARELSAAALGALAHLYRGEVYRSTIWRTRLDTTTNWSKSKKSVNRKSENRCQTPFFRRNGV